jgi:glycogen phosphorylase
MDERLTYRLIAPWAPGAGDMARGSDMLAIRLPAALRPLADIAYNYRWAWTPGGPELFARIDPERWAAGEHNPVHLLQETSPIRLEGIAADPSFVEAARALHTVIRRDLQRPPATAETDTPSASRPVAFLCAEFGVHPSLPVYAGGLGILAGDVLKEASDQALPLVGVGLLYREGYLHQHIDRSGWQHEYWLGTDPERLPAALVTTAGGAPLTVEVAIRGRTVAAQVWRIDVGRVPLYLLDTRLPENTAIDRWITARLYVGDRQMRLAQYALLGIGGMRALAAMGITPGVVHLNEGHAALAPLEIARGLVAEGADPEQALAEARERTVFTTHTPVAAGNEAYWPGELLETLDGFGDAVGVGTDELLGLGRIRPEDPHEPFGVTPLGIRMSRGANAVSRLHAGTARGMWEPLLASLPSERTITHVTNGVHLPTWMAPEMRALLTTHLGEGWETRAADPATWEPVGGIPDGELWAIRKVLRSRLVEFVRERSVHDRLSRGEPLDRVEAAAHAFDAEALTVGFARRAAAYKRVYLLIHDIGRALALLDGSRSVQMVLAGKSHPEDEEAKRILQGVMRLKAEPLVSERVAFLHDYDMGIAERLVAGCDVWLNLPRYPLEASGTSGMKSALNGGLNLSVLDGWWDEAYDREAGSNGWAIPPDPDAPAEAQDARDAAALYDILENQVVPLWADRGPDGISHGWCAKLKASLVTIGPRFCATRMMQDYLATAYRRPVRTG